MSSLRHRLGAIVYDWPRFLRHIGRDWKLIHNRNEAITTDGRGIRCDWEDGSWLHIADTFPSAARWLLRRALADWPITLRDEPPNASAAPEVSFVIGHRGRERLPHLLTTLRSIAGQKGVSVECIVVEQSGQPEVEAALPGWVRYLHTATDATGPYCRSAAFNAGASVARASTLVLHDNDLLVPERYAAEVRTRVEDGWDFVDPKRFIFYVDEPDVGDYLQGVVASNVATKVAQNLRGGSVASTARAFFAIGGFDEDFVGWGGEDVEFWERASCSGRSNAFGHLPLIHLFHQAQTGKAQPHSPAVQRYSSQRAIPPAERIRRLLLLRPPSWPGAARETPREHAP
jgi:hypothetical protein